MWVGARGLKFTYGLRVAMMLRGSWYCSFKLRLHRQTVCLHTGEGLWDFRLENLGCKQVQTLSFPARALAGNQGSGCDSFSSSVNEKP